MSNQQQTRGRSGYRRHHGVALAALPLAILAASQPAQAQIEEIVVTAQKREQPLQDVPIAVSAFDANAINGSRLDDLQEIALRTPSFNIGQNGPSAPELTIRGIGSTDREAGSDRSVVVFVDEVYIGRAGASTFDFFDLERVEVLRGPQGSIFGRNVVGGSVNLITARPTFEREAGFEFTAGDLDLLELKGVINGSLSENAAGRVAVSLKQRDGYYENRLFGGDSTNNTESYSVRGRVLFEPSENMSWLFTLEASSDEVDGIGSAITQGETTDADFNKQFMDRFDGGSMPQSDLLGDDPEASSPYRVDNNEFGGFERDILAFSARMDLTTDFGVVTFLPAYRSTQFDIIRDLVGIPIHDPDNTTYVNVAEETLGYRRGFGFESTAINDEDYTALSVELRLSSLPDSGRLTWLAGLYYLDEQIDRIQIRERQLSDTTPNKQTISRPRFDQSNAVTSLAAFGQLHYQVSDYVGLTFGARYTADEKDFSLSVDDTLDEAARARIMAAIPDTTISLSPAAAEFSAKASDRFEEFTPEATIDIRVSDSAFFYLKGSTGFKSGGFVGLGANATQATLPFEPETVLNLEGGLKGDFFDQRLRFNASLFQMDFEELQLRDRQLLVAGDESTAIVTTVNAAEAEIKGFEADITINPADGLLITGGASWLDTEITDVAEGSTIRKGTVLPKAPEFSTSWAVDWDVAQLGSGNLSLRGEMQYRDSMFFDINEDTGGHEPSNALYGLRLAYAAADDSWSVALWGKNLTDEFYRTQVQSAFGDDVGIISTLGEPRTWGLTIRRNLAN